MNNHLYAGEMFYGVALTPWSALIRTPKVIGANDDEATKTIFSLIHFILLSGGWPASLFHCGPQPKSYRNGELVVPLT